MLSHSSPEDLTLMRTSTIDLFSDIAVKAQDLKSPILRKSFFTQPSIEAATTACNLAVFGPVVIDMIYGKYLKLFLATACTSATIGRKGFLAKVSMPDLHGSFLTRFQANMLEPIMVMAKNLVSSREAILAQPLIETMPTASNTTVISTIIVNVINREKRWTRLATYYTGVAICREDLITKLVCISLLIVMTALAEISNFSRTSETFRAHTSRSFPCRAIVTLVVLTITLGITLFRRCRRVVSLYSLFSENKRFLRTAARIANTTASLLWLVLLIEAVSRKPLLALMAIDSIRVILLPLVAFITEAIECSNANMAPDTEMRVPSNICFVNTLFTKIAQSRLTIFIKSPVIRSGREPLFTISALLLKRCISRIITFLCCIPFGSAFFTATAKTVLVGFVSLPVFGGCWEPLMTYRTTFRLQRRHRICCCILLMLGITACFTMAMQTVLPRFVSMPVLSSSRVSLLASRAVLWFRTMISNNVQNWLRNRHHSQLIKVKLDLANVWVYTTFHGIGSLLFHHAQDVNGIAGHNHVIPQVYHINLDLPTFPTQKYYSFML